MFEKKFAFERPTGAGFRRIARATTEMAEDQARKIVVDQRRPRILLAITGSVAAIKGPEMAVRLVEEVKADVKILLTRGGQNFWDKAESYDPQHWKKLQQMLLKMDTEPPIAIHCKQ